LEILDFRSICDCLIVGTPWQSRSRAAGCRPRTVRSFPAPLAADPLKPSDTLVHHRGVMALRQNIAAPFVLALVVATTSVPRSVVSQQVKPVAVVAEEVEFQSAGVSLSGTLLYPEATRPVAAVVLIHGSGPEARMMWWARPLAADGLAVLTYDKRGAGRSGGVYEGDNNVSAANLDLLAQDAVAALDVMSRHPRLQKLPLGFLGASQAGWIAPIAATKSSATDFIVLSSGPVSTVAEELPFGAWAERTPDFHQKNTAQDVAKYLETVMYHPGDVDPRESLSRLSIPGLWVFGSNDSSVPVALSAIRLEELIKGGHAYEYRVFPGLGHNFQGLREDPRYTHIVSWITRLAAR
jgi:pimeloyl-ACP methyl ester carboxylesterase